MTDHFSPVEYGEKLFTIFAIIIALLLIIFFMALVGHTLRKAIFRWLPMEALTVSQTIPIDLGLGFAAVSWMALFLGITNLYTAQNVLAVVILVLILCRKSLTNCGQDMWQLFAKLSLNLRQHPWLATVLNSYILMRGLQTILPKSHGDPLYYHLASAWQYALGSGVKFFPWAPWFLQGGMAEYNYGLLGLATNNRMLMMILAQNLHFVFSYPCTGLIIFSICKDLSMPTNLAFIAVLGSLTFVDGGEALICAKNDGFVLFYELIALQFSLKFLHNCRDISLSHESISAKFAPLIVAIFAGCYAFSIKYTAAFFLLPIFLTIGVFCWKTARPQLRFMATLQVIFVAFVILSPNLIRNFVFTKNPFFPALPQLFPSPYLNETLSKIVRNFTYTNGTISQIIFDQLSKTIFSKPIFIFSLGGFFVSDKRVKALAFLSVTTILLISVVTGRGLYSRFSFFLFPVMTIIGCYVCAFVWQFFCFRDSTVDPLDSRNPFKICKYQRLMIGIIFILALVSGQIELPLLFSVKELTPFLLSHDSYATYFRRKKPSFAIHHWINDSGLKGKILSLGDNESFFLDLPLSVPENQLDAATVVEATSAKSRLEMMDRGGFTYLLVPPRWPTPYRDLLLNDTEFMQHFALSYQSLEGYRLYQKF